MTDRVTVAEVRGMFGRAEIAARMCGLDTHGWYLMTGSRVDGRAWRLFTRPGGGTALTGLDRGFLGLTAREARDTLHALATAWEAVQDRYPPECEVCGRNDLATTMPPRCTRHRGVVDPQGMIAAEYEYETTRQQHCPSCSPAREDTSILADLGEVNSG